VELGRTLDLKQYLVILDAQVKAGNGFACWRSECAAGRDIKNGAMPRTSNFGTVNFALAKRTADVRATVVKGMKGARNVKECYLAAVDLDQFGLARNDLTNFRYSYVFGHETNYCALFVAEIARKDSCEPSKLCIKLEAQLSISIELKLSTTFPPRGLAWELNCPA